ncbi:MAG: hypothetical protein ABI408_12485 [Gemmatimonadaceae bacterium]
MRTPIRALLATIVVSSGAHAQGALSTSGLGYPTGQISARSEGAGGSLADFDALSLVAPAAIAGVGAPALFFQYSPEFRRVTDGANSARTTTARFPLVSGVLPVGQRWTMGLSSSTFLDRSYETSLVRIQSVGSPTNPADSVSVTERTKVLGAINDIRLSAAWAGSPIFRIGAGAHVFSGSNRVSLSEIFPDSSRFIGATQTDRISFAGLAASVGVEYHPSRVIAFSLSARKGGDLTAQSGDTTLGKGKIPDHYSGSIIYDGITGATFAARVAHDSWSSLSSLSSSHILAFDGWDTSVGGELSGPRLLQRIIVIRAGARFRTLPFAALGEKVTEHTFSAGLGVPLTRERAAFDFALQRASRSTPGTIKETGYILSFGLRVSP